MITDWVGGVQKGQNLDSVIFEWSHTKGVWLNLMKFTENMNFTCHSYFDVPLNFTGLKLALDSNFTCFHHKKWVFPFWKSVSFWYDCRNLIFESVDGIMFSLVISYSLILKYLQKCEILVLNRLCWHIESPFWR